MHYCFYIDTENMLIVRKRQSKLIKRALRLMAETMRIVIQIYNSHGGGDVLVFAELLAVVLFVFASCTTD